MTQVTLNDVTCHMVIIVLLCYVIVSVLYCSFDISKPNESSVQAGREEAGSWYYIGGHNSPQCSERAQTEQ